MPRKPKSTFGNWLRARRKKLNISQRKAAIAGGCSCATLCALERGGNNYVMNMTLGMLACIAKGYQVSPGELIRHLDVRGLL